MMLYGMIGLCIFFCLIIIHEHEHIFETTRFDSPYIGNYNKL